MAQHQKKLWQELLLLGTSLACSAGVMMWAIDRLDPQRDTKIAAKKRKLELQRRLGISLDLNSYEEMLAGDVINPAELSVSLEDIGGLKSIVNALYNKVIAPLQRPQLFSGSPLLKPSKGVLLYGPPGTGKTMLAKAIAKESCARFINIRASSIQSKWLGDTQKLVTGLFTLAWKLQPCIIFIDEIDALLGKRTGTEHDAITSMKTEFMQLWDGFMTQSDAHVLVLAATNRPWDLDEAVLRRLPLAYEVGLPDAVQRESILKVMLQNELKARGKECMDEKLVLNQPERGLRPLQRIAQQTVGYSGSDLMELCKQAACRPVHEYMDTVFGVHSIDSSDEDEPSCGADAGPRPIVYEDLEAAIPLSRPSSEHAERYMSVQSNRSAWTQPAPSAEGSSSSATGMSVDQMKLLQMMLPLLNAIQKKTAEANGDAGQPPDGNGST